MLVVNRIPVVMPIALFVPEARAPRGIWQLKAMLESQSPRNCCEPDLDLATRLSNGPALGCTELSRELRSRPVTRDTSARIFYSALRGSTGGESCRCLQCLALQVAPRPPRL